MAKVFGTASGTREVPTIGDISLRLHQQMRSSARGVSHHLWGTKGHQGGLRIVHFYG